MHDADRRAFLKKLAATTAYAAPVVRTLAAPDPAAGQALSKKGGNGGGDGMGKGKSDWAMDMDMGKSDWAMNMGFDRTLPEAPWSRED
jgi:hypothetical protein